MKKVICSLLFLSALTTIFLRCPQSLAQSISYKRPPVEAEKDINEISFRNVARHMPQQWYKSREAQRVADSVLVYQFPSGGWAKNQN